MKPRLLEKGDIVQIDPAVPEVGGCLLIVDEVAPWGVIGHIPVPGQTLPKFYRCPWPDMEATRGIAAWILGSYQERS